MLSPVRLQFIGKCLNGEARRLFISRAMKHLEIPILVESLRDRLPKKQALYVLRAENILVGPAYACIAHGTEAYRLRISASNIICHGSRVDKASRDDLIGSDRVHDSLRTRACRMDHRLSGKIHAGDTARRIAEIAARDLRPAPLAEEHPVRMRALHRESLLHLADRIDLLRSLFKEICFKRKCAENVYYDRQALRLFRAVYEFEYIYVHECSFHQSCG